MSATARLAEMVAAWPGPAERFCECGHGIGRHEIRSGGLLGCYIDGCLCVDFADDRGPADVPADVLPQGSSDGLAGLHAQLDAVTREMVAAIRRGDLAAAKGHDAEADELADRIVVGG